MKMTRRQQVGVALIAVSIVVAVVIQATGELFHLRTEVEPALVRGPITTEVILTTVTVTWRYALPLAACALCGSLLAVIPPRRA
jgi:hypothetical protein